MAAGLPGTKVLQIRDDLLAAFPNRAAVVELFMAIDRSYDQHEVSSLSLSANLAQVLNAASSEGWLTGLLSAAAAARAGDARLADLARIYASADPGPVDRGAASPTPIAAMAGAPMPVGRVEVDHFRRCQLSGGFVMVDRDPLRHSMVELHRVDGQRILVVTGDAGSGKSYTRRLVWHLRDALGTFSVADIDLEREARLLGPGRTFAPDDIARLLVRGLRYRLQVPLPPDDMQWARWNDQFCADLEYHALSDPERRWIVIDAFNKVTLSDEVLDLIKQLAIRISEQLSSVRLVLVGLTQELPPALRPTVRPDRPGPIGVRQLSEFLVDYLDQEGSSLDAAARAQLAAELIHKVVDGLDPDRPSYLATLSERLTEGLPRLKGSQP